MRQVHILRDQSEFYLGYKYCTATSAESFHLWFPSFPRKRNLFGLPLPSENFTSDYGAWPRRRFSRWGWWPWEWILSCSICFSFCLFLVHFWFLWNWIATWNLEVHVIAGKRCYKRAIGVFNRCIPQNVLHYLFCGKVPCINYCIHVYQGSTLLVLYIYIHVYYCVCHVCRCFIVIGFSCSELWDPWRMLFDAFFLIHDFIEEALNQGLENLLAVEGVWLMERGSFGCRMAAALLFTLKFEWHFRRICSLVLDKLVFGKKKIAKFSMQHNYTYSPNVVAEH